MASYQSVAGKRGSGAEVDESLCAKAEVIEAEARSPLVKLIRDSPVSLVRAYEESSMHRGNRRKLPADTTRCQGPVATALASRRKFSRPRSEQIIPTIQRSL